MTRSHPVRSAIFWLTLVAVVEFFSAPILGQLSVAQGAISAILDRTEGTPVIAPARLDRRAHQP